MLYVHHSVFLLAYENVATIVVYWTDRTMCGELLQWPDILSVLINWMHTTDYLRTHREILFMEDLISIIVRNLTDTSCCQPIIYTFLSCCKLSLSINMSVVLIKVLFSSVPSQGAKEEPVYGEEAAQETKYSPLVCKIIEWLENKQQNL